MHTKQLQMFCSFLLDKLLINLSQPSASENIRLSPVIYTIHVSGVVLCSLQTCYILIGQDPINHSLYILSSISMKSYFSLFLKWYSLNFLSPHFVQFSIPG